MATSNGVKFVPKMSLPKQRSKFAVRRQQAFLFSACEKKVGRCFRACMVEQDKGIVIAAGRAAGRPENRFVVSGLLEPLNGKCAPGNVDSGTQSTGEGK